MGKTPANPGDVMIKGISSGFILMSISFIFLGISLYLTSEDIIEKILSLFVIITGFIAIIPFIIGPRFILSNNGIENIFKPFKPDKMSWNEVDTICFIFNKKNELLYIEIRSVNNKIIVSQDAFGKKSLNKIWKSLLLKVREHNNIKLRQRIRKS